VGSDVIERAVSLHQGFPYSFAGAAGRPPARAALAERHNEAMTTTPAVLRDANETLAYRIATMLFGVGTLHFLAPKPFDEIVPAELPGSPRMYTYASGVAELGVGALLLARGTRRFGALAAAALFVGVFPANVNMVRLWWDKPWPMRVFALARLPLQIPMITSALKIRRNS
jgi:uncharacterized membrane protein